MLDFKLVEITANKGVRIIDHCTVTDTSFDENIFTITTSQGIFTSEIVVGAWGKKSNLDIKFERPFTKENKREKNYVGIKYHVTIDFPNDLIELHNFENGYCGISKIEDVKYCLCYITDSENLKKYYGDIKQMEKEVLMQNPFLKKYFAEAKFLFDEPLAISQIKTGYKNAVENNILMLGDAAGNIAPLSGNGMSMTLRSSFELNKLLLNYFNKSITRKELESKYETFWKQQFKEG